MQWMLAGPVFRVRFGASWACDPVDLGDEDGRPDPVV
jgi:hypothetical protein